MLAEKIHLASTLLFQARRVVAFSGAGLSAESGISTFRHSDTGGLWAKYDPIQLASPQGFADDPELVIDWYAERRLTIAKASPNHAHYALATKPNLINVTQNVDDLLERAGAHDVVHLHGTLTEDHCHAQCGYREKISMVNPPGLWECPKCRGRMRPSVVWFGEMLPSDDFEKAVELSSACDVLLVVGTSAAVYPASGLIEVAYRANAKIIVVNTEPSDASHLAHVELLGKAGEVLPKILPSRSYKKRE